MIQAQAMAARMACTQMTVLHLTALHDSVERGRGLAGRSQWGRKAAAGAADPLGQAIPFFALRAALREPFAGLTADDRGREPPDATAWWITQIRAHLEQRSAETPVLVCLDDLHRADPATLAALRTLPRDLKRHPVAWLLARPTGPGRPDHP